MNCLRCDSPINKDDPVCQCCGRIVKSSPMAISASGGELRAKVLEVVVRQAMGREDWRMVCALAMQINAISQAEVVAEVARRGGTALTPAKIVLHGAKDAHHHGDDHDSPKDKSQAQQKWMNTSKGQVGQSGAQTTAGGGQFAGRLGEAKDHKGQAAPAPPGSLRDKVREAMRTSEHPVLSLGPDEAMTGMASGLIDPLSGSQSGEVDLTKQWISSPTEHDAASKPAYEDPFKQWMRDSSGHDQVAKPVDDGFKQRMIDTAEHNTLSKPATDAGKQRMIDTSENSYMQKPAADEPLKHWMIDSAGHAVPKPIDDDPLKQWIIDPAEQSALSKPTPEDPLKQWLISPTEKAGSHPSSKWMTTASEYPTLPDDSGTDALKEWITRTSEYSGPPKQSEIDALQEWISRTAEHPVLPSDANEPATTDDWMTKSAEYQALAAESLQSWMKRSAENPTASGAHAPKPPEHPASPGKQAPDAGQHDATKPPGRSKGPEPFSTMKWNSISAEHPVAQDQSASGAHPQIKGPAPAKAGEHHSHTEGPINPIALAAPMTTSYNQLAELRLRLVALVQDSNSDVFALKSEMVKVAAQLDQTLLHLQREITKVQATQAQINAKMNMDAQRNTLPPKLPERKPKRSE